MCESLNDSTPESPLNSTHIQLALHHHIQYDIVNTYPYERDTIIASVDGKAVEQQFNSVTEALIWLFEKETGKQLKVKHYFSGAMNSCAK